MARSAYSTITYPCRILNDTLTIEKMESGTYLLEMKPVQLREVIGSIVNSMQPWARDKSITLTAEFIDGIPEWVRADPNRLSQVLANFLSNALKFVDQHGQGKIAVQVFPIEQPSPTMADEDTSATEIPHSIVTEQGLVVMVPTAETEPTGPSPSPHSPPILLGGLLRKKLKFLQGPPQTTVIMPTSALPPVTPSAPVASPVSDEMPTPLRPKNWTRRNGFARKIPKRAPAEGAEESKQDTAISVNGNLSPAEQPIVWIRIQVIDNGVGISPENLAKLWQPFSQIEAGIRQKGKGSGLGLHICKEIVRHHGGRVGVRSRLNAGSTFYAEIPFQVCDRPESESLPSGTTPGGVSSASSPGVHGSAPSAGELPKPQQLGIVDHLVILIVDDGTSLKRARYSVL
jgi:signal transduction histidine kinase